MKSVVLKLVVLMVITGGAFAGYHWWQARANPAAQPYRFAKIERGAIQSVVAASGTLAAVTTVQVGSQISGQVLEVLADFNTPVKAGQIIARIDPASFELKVSQTRADVEAAKSAVALQRAAQAAQRAERSRVLVNLAEAERDYQRKKSLVERSFLSPAERDRAKTLLDATQEQLNAVDAQIRVNEAQVASALAAVRQREALARQSEVDLERTIIRAPVDGTVILRNVDAGQTVAASLQAPVLFTIAQDLRDMQVEAAIDEADIGRIRAGQEVSFTVDAFQRRSFSGAVQQIRKSPVTAQNVVSYTVVISAANADLTLLPGMTANVRIVIDQRENVLKVANAALRFRPAEAAGAKPDAAAGAGNEPPSASTAQPAAGRGGSQALQRFRKRLVEELKLDDAQLSRLDAILDQARGQFILLRDQTEARERQKKSERIRVDMRQRIAEILRPDQRPAYDRIIAEIAGRSGRAATGRVWRIASGQLVPVVVRLGLSDGTSTEIAGKDLTEGVDLVIGQAPAAAGGGPFSSRLRLF